MSTRLSDALSKRKPTPPVVEALLKVNPVSHEAVDKALEQYFPEGVSRGRIRFNRSDTNYS